MTKVLIVDDSDVDQLLIEGLLKQNSDFDVFKAGNGVQALRKLEEWSFDIVITDLQMPKMDGLQLVKSMRENKFEVPVVLTTGAGSEEIAASALRAGAAGYIPKSDLNEMLIPTINDVLEIFNSDQGYERLLARTKLCRYEIELENDPTLIPLMVDFCERILSSSSPLDRIDCLRIAIAIDQALKNALYRGNLEIDAEQNVQRFGHQFDTEELPGYVSKRFNEEPYKNRSIKVVLEVKPSGFAIRISDEGPGFDTSTIGDMSRLSTRGTNLMKAFMDSVQYNELGNDVLMSFRFDRSRSTNKWKSPDEKVFIDVLGKLVCQSSGDVHVITNRKYVIGSGTACHLKIQGDSIAKMHCMLITDGDQAVAVNLSNEFETLLNGKVSNGESVKQGDLLTVGHTTFKFSTQQSTSSD